MISKSQIKDIKSLHLSKFRQIYNNFIAEGEKVCIELLKSNKYQILKIFIIQEDSFRFEPFVSKFSSITYLVTEREMGQMSALKTNSNILLLLEKIEESLYNISNSKFSAIYLDKVQDPGNVGTIIRIADWFGIDAVIRSHESADFYNPKVIQATMGSIVNVNCITAELSELSKLNKPIYGSFMDGKKLNDLTLDPNGIIVLGSEGQGISIGNEKYINQRITIPGAINKTAESLNVGVATGILCAHWKS